MKIITKNKELLRVILSVALIIVGITHFTAWEQYVKIVPPIFPNALAMVYISGFFEVLGGIGLLVPAVSRAAAWGILILFIAVFPANIYQATHHIHIDGVPYSESPWFQVFRLPMQPVLIAWAWWYTKSTKGEKQAVIIETKDFNGL